MNLSQSVSELLNWFQLMVYNSPKTWKVTLYLGYTIWITASIKMGSTFNIVSKIVIFNFQDPLQII